MTTPYDKRQDRVANLFRELFPSQQRTAEDVAVDAFLASLSTAAARWLNAEGVRLERMVVDRQLDPDQLDAAFTVAAHEAKRMQDEGTIPPRYPPPSGRAPEPEVNITTGNNPRPSGTSQTVTFRRPSPTMTPRARPRVSPSRHRVGLLALVNRRIRRRTRRRSPSRPTCRA